MELFEGFSCLCAVSEFFGIADDFAFYALVNVGYKQNVCNELR